MSLADFLNPEAIVTSLGTIGVICTLFIETGLLIGLVLPGDSLLFAVGALAGKQLIQVEIVTPLLLVAAILGDAVNYSIGKWMGPKVFHMESSRFFNKAHLMKAHEFYEKYGGITIVAARFMPFLRTFAPFVAGVAQMTRRKFTFYDVTGGALWVGGIVTVGYFFGNIPWVKTHLDKIIWAMIFVPGLLVLLGSWRARRRSDAS